MRTLLTVVLALLLGALAYNLWERFTAERPTEPMITGFRRMNELTVFMAQVVAVPTSTEDGVIDALDRSQTDIYRARVRYSVDLSKLRDRDVSWDPVKRSAIVVVQPVLVQRPELDSTSRRSFRDGLLAPAATWDRLGRSNAVKASREAVALARAPELMRMAEASARDAIAANAELFLHGAGEKDVKVIVRFATEGSLPSGKDWDVSRQPSEVLGAAR